MGCWSILGYLDQERISPYYINTISSRQVTRRKKNISIRVLLIDPIPKKQNNIKIITWQTVRRITKEIKEAKGLTVCLYSWTLLRGEKRHSGGWYTLPKAISLWAWTSRCKVLGSGLEPDVSPTGADPGMFFFFRWGADVDSENTKFLICIALHLKKLRNILDKQILSCLRRNFGFFFYPRVWWWGNEVRIPPPQINFVLWLITRSSRLPKFSSSIQTLLL